MICLPTVSSNQMTVAVKPNCYITHIWKGNKYLLDTFCWACIKRVYIPIEFNEYITAVAASMQLFLSSVRNMLLLCYSTVLSEYVYFYDGRLNLKASCTRLNEIPMLVETTGHWDTVRALCREVHWHWTSVLPNCCRVFSSKCWALTDVIHV